MIHQFSILKYQVDRESHYSLCDFFSVSLSLPQVAIAKKEHIIGDGEICRYHAPKGYKSHT